MAETLDIPRRECDTRKSYPALCDYLRMGAGRSLRKLHAEYEEQSVSGSGTEPPTKYLSTLTRWSSEHDWADRAEEYDRRVEAFKEEQARQTLKEGLALDHHRVDKLKSIYDRLEEELEENEALWLEDVKQIGKGDQMQVVEILRYNSSLISDLRGLLDDLAKETGGRKKKVEHAGQDGGPIQTVNANIDLSDFEDTDDPTELMNLFTERFGRSD